MRIHRHGQTRSITLRTVLRSWPSARRSRTRQTCWCNSRIIIHPFRLTTRPPHVGLQDDDAQARAPSAAGPRPGCARRSNWGIFNRRIWGVFVRRRQTDVIFTGMHRQSNPRNPKSQGLPPSSRSSWPRVPDSGRCAATCRCTTPVKVRTVTGPPRFAARRQLWRFGTRRHASP